MINDCNFSLIYYQIARSKASRYLATVPAVAEMAATLSEKIRVVNGDSN